MNYLSLLLTCTVVFFAHAAFATDHTVAVGGAPPVFQTISAAMSAAVDGDRILVHPGTYAGFGVDKSVEVLAQSADSGFTVAGDINVYTAPGRELMLSGANLLGKLLHPDAGFTPTQVMITLSGCTFNNVDMPSGCTLLRMHGCIVKGYLSFARGTITWCRIKGNAALMPAGASVVSLTSGGPTGNSSVRRFLVGNIIGEEIASTYTPSVVTLETDAPFTFSNNLVRGTSAPNAKPKVKTKKPKETYLQVTLDECLVSSVSMLIPGSGGGPWLEDSVSMFQPAFTTLVHNNFIVNAQPFIGNATCFQQAYNVFTSSTSAIDAITGQPTAGSPAINAGDPSTAYLDLDLSRNDAGCWGGSWSMSNFINAGAGPRVTLVNAPRTVVSGTSVAIDATAVQR